MGKLVQYQIATKHTNAYAYVMVYTWGVKHDVPCIVRSEPLRGHSDESVHE